MTHVVKYEVLIKGFLVSKKKEFPTLSQAVAWARKMWNSGKTYGKPEICENE